MSNQSFELVFICEHTGLEVVVDSRTDIILDGCHCCYEEELEAFDHVYTDNEIRVMVILDGCTGSCHMKCNYCCRLEIVECQNIKEIKTRLKLNK